MKLKYLVYAGISMILISCNKFEEINTNADSATKINSSLLATGAIMGIMKPSVGASFVDHMFLTKYLAWGEGSRGAQYNEFGRDNFGGYTALKDYRLMAELSPDKSKEAYKAMALLLESYRIYNYTISVGDIPYSEAIRGKEGGLAPKYDTQKEVILSILSNLEEADALFAEAKNFDGDPIYNGDVIRWRKINTALYLRILIGLSKKEDDSDLNLKNRIQNVLQKGTLMQSNDDNLQLVFSEKAGQLYPFHHSQNKHYTYPMVSSTLIDILKKHEDYRLFYYAAPSEERIQSGLSSKDWEAYPGVDVSIPIEKIKEVFTARKHCSLNDRYISYESGEPYIIFGYAEQQFILAEAALRNFIEQDPSKFYIEGIKASLTFTSQYTPDKTDYHSGRKITNDYITDFVTRASLQLNGDFATNLERIMEQKYVASFMQLAYQPYYDYRRTGYPVFPINPETNLNFREPTKIPVRWLYPDSEFSYNKQNVEDAIERQYGGIDEVNQVMWMLK